MKTDQFYLEQAILAAARLISLQHESGRPFGKAQRREMAELVGVVQSCVRNVVRIPGALELFEGRAQSLAAQAYAHSPVARQAAMMSAVCRLAFLYPLLIYRGAVTEGLLLVVHYTALSLGDRKLGRPPVRLQTAPLTAREGALLRLLEIVGCHLVEELDDTPEPLLREVQRLEQFYHRQVELVTPPPAERQDEYWLTRRLIIAGATSLDGWLAMSLQTLSDLLVRHHPETPSQIPDALFELLLTQRQQLAMT